MTCNFEKFRYFSKFIDEFEIYRNFVCRKKMDSTTRFLSNHPPTCWSFFLWCFDTHVHTPTPTHTHTHTHPQTQCTHTHTHTHTQWCLHTQGILVNCFVVCYLFRCQLQHITHNLIHSIWRFHHASIHFSSIAVMSLL